MGFEIGSSSQLGLNDNQLSELLESVYVNEAYTTPELAKALFKPQSVRSRGTIFIAREKLMRDFAVMIVIVPSSSSARVLANKDECEMHLLAIKAEYRRFCLGRRLVEVSLEYAKKNGQVKMLLWTQKGMKNAQNLYESCGFEETGKMKKNGIEFLIYEKHCV